MYQLIESICVRDGNFQRLPLHEARIDRALAALCITRNWSLEDALEKTEVPSSGLFKCRVRYTSDSFKIEFQPYNIHPVQSLKLVEASHVDYQHKWEDRSVLQLLWQQREGFDDVLMVKNGWVTDTFYANIVFRKGDEWFTPETFLLQGTMREALIKSGKIQEVRMRVADIYQFDSFKLINALMEWNAPESDVFNIH